MDSPRKRIAYADVTDPSTLVQLYLLIYVCSNYFFYYDGNFGNCITIKILVYSHCNPGTDANRQETIDTLVIAF